jgi:hypothetical protein
MEATNDQKMQSPKYTKGSNDIRILPLKETGIGKNSSGKGFQLKKEYKFNDSDGQSQNKRSAKNESV